MKSVGPFQDTTPQVRLLIARYLELCASDAELVAQIQRVRVVGGPLTMLQLAVHGEVEMSAHVDGPISPRVGVVDARGHVVGEMLVWVTSGLLSALEYAWYTTEPPRRLPEPESLKVIG